MKRTYATSLDRYRHTFAPNNGNAGQLSPDVVAEAGSSVHDIDVRYTMAKKTIQLISKTLDGKIIDFQRLLHYLCDSNYYIYSTHEKHVDLVSICLDENANQTARQELKIEDIRVFTRDEKFWQIAYETVKEQKKVKRTAELALENKKPTKNQLRVVFSTNWLKNKKHNSLMVSIEGTNGPEILCTTCNYASFCKILCDDRSNAYKLPKYILNVSLGSLGSHYASNGHQNGTQQEPSKAVMYFFFLKFYSLCFCLCFCLKLFCCLLSSFGLH